MKNKKIYIISGAIILFFTFLILIKFISSNKIYVKSQEVIEGNIKKYINLIGEVESNNIERFNFSDGRPRSINVKVGDKISKGTIIATSISGNSTSSIDGVVTKVEEGDTSFVGINTSTVIVQDINDLKLVVEVNKNDFKEIKLGQKALIINNDGNVINGEVSFINPTAERKNKITDNESYIKIDINILESSEGFTIGFNNEVDILVGEANNTVVAPIEAIVTEKGNINYAYVISNDNLVKREIVIGLEGEQEVEILEGLSAGEEVVLNPNNTLSDGIKVYRR